MPHVQSYRRKDGKLVFKRNYKRGSGSWIGSPHLKISTKEIGVVVRDDNWGMGRTLTVDLGDRTEDFTVANVGFTSPQDYAWWFGSDEDISKGEWVQWSDSVSKPIRAQPPEFEG